VLARRCADGCGDAGGSGICGAEAGEAAPDFTTQATLAGKPFTFALAAALKSGPVVLYFYPAAFSKGCTVEAHEFAGSDRKIQRTRRGR